MRKTQDRALHHRRTRYKPGLGVCRCPVCREASIRANDDARDGKPHPKMGSVVPGCQYVNPEKAFADQWEKENRPSLSRGMSLVQALMVVYRPGETTSGPFRGGRVAFWLTPRERVIVASVIQWLGTNVGFCFLRQALERCGYTIVESDRKVPPSRRITPHPEVPMPGGQVSVERFRGLVEEEI